MVGLAGRGRGSDGPAQRSLRPVPDLSPVPGADLSGLVRACLGAPARCGDTRVVAVDGRSGSGKSVLARALAERVAAVRPPVPVPVQIVGLDDVYPGWDGLLGTVPLLIWVQAPDGVRRTRAIHRDGPALARQWQRWADQ